MARDETETAGTEAKPKSGSNKAKDYNEILAGLDGLNPKLPTFGHRFHVSEPQPGVRLLLKEGELQQVGLVGEDALAGPIMTYCNNRIGKPRLMVTMTQAREVARMWMHSSAPVAEPKPVAMLSEPGLTFHRLPFDPDAGACPVFTELLERCTNAKALMVFIGSLFDPDADRQQYVWLHGGGNNGKGSLARLLSRLLGPAYHSEVVPDAKRGVNQFWTASFLGKRLVAFPDCNSPQFPQGGLFKSLTGGDSIRIEKKNRDPFSVELNCKFLFLSNEQVVLSSQTSDMRRAIYCFVGPISSPPDPDYEKKLWAEAPQILWICQAAYRDWCGPGARIQVEGDIEELTALHDARFEDLFYRHFDKVQDDHLPMDSREYVTPVDLAGVFREQSITNSREQRKYIEFWERRFGVQGYRPPHSVDGARPGRRYVGMRRKLTNLVAFENLGRRRRGPGDDQG